MKGLNVDGWMMMMIMANRFTVSLNQRVVVVFGGCCVLMEISIPLTHELSSSVSLCVGLALQAYMILQRAAEAIEKEKQKQEEKKAKAMNIFEQTMASNQVALQIKEDKRRMEREADVKFLSCLTFFFESVYPKNFSSNFLRLFFLTVFSNPYISRCTHGSDCHNHQRTIFFRPSSS